MKKTYRMTIETKKGGSLPSLECLHSAVLNTAIHGDDYLKVEIAARPAKEVKVDTLAPLYALGLKEGEIKTWRLIDYFPSKKRAEEALKKSVENYRNNSPHGKFAFPNSLHGKFALLVFSAGVGTWEMEGKPVDPYRPAAIG